MEHNVSLSEILSGTVPPAPTPKTAKKQRTAAATKVRKKAYDKAVRLMVKPLKEIRSYGFTSADAIAEMLNALKVPAPNEIIWTKNSVLRALRRLRELGLEPKKEVSGYADGPYHPLDLKKPKDLKLYLALVQETKQVEEEKKAKLCQDFFNSL
jgi:hypothetical protein